MPVLIIVVLILAVLLVMLIWQNARNIEALRGLREEARARELKASADDENRRVSLENAVRTLDDHLRSYDTRLREWESDRAQKFGQIEKDLAHASQATLRLQETTDQLKNVLGNVKLRGQWGERMAEDIIRYAGLLENVNYRKQTALASGATRPDYTFLLPEGRIVNMDVKFPLDNYLRMVNATGDAERAGCEKDFFRDVRGRVKELRHREYINPQENTLDFVILFIPNEQVYAFIHEREPGLMDETMAEKVVMCSPFTLYAVLSVIRQAHENFRFEKDVRKILTHVDLFAGHFENFRVRFAEIGEIIAKLDGKYADVRDKSFKQLETKLRHIEEYKKGQAAVPEEIV